MIMIIIINNNKNKNKIHTGNFILAASEARQLILANAHLVQILSSKSISAPKCPVVKSPESSVGGDCLWLISAEPSTALPEPVPFPWRLFCSPCPSGQLSFAVGVS